MGGFQKRASTIPETYAYKKNWGKDNPETKKFEGKFKTVTRVPGFYSETLKKALGEHARSTTPLVDDILQGQRLARAHGELAFVSHYESPKRHGSETEYPFYPS